MAKPNIQVVAGIILNDNGDVLVTRRKADSHLGGLWEFPGGHIEADEQPQDALRRELVEEVNLEVNIGPLYWREVFEYDIKIVDIAFYLASLHPPNQQPVARHVSAFRWIAPNELSRLSFPKADTALIEKLIADPKLKHYSTQLS